jgi:4-carboxymuconolactone decarboxylase
MVTKAMTAFKVLPDSVRQIVILAVGARFKSAYKIYAHTAVARARHEISDARLATLAARQRPSDLSESRLCENALALLAGSRGSVSEAVSQRNTVMRSESVR